MSISCDESEQKGSEQLLGKLTLYLKEETEVPVFYGANSVKIGSLSFELHMDPSSKNLLVRRRFISSDQRDVIRDAVSKLENDRFHRNVMIFK